MSRSIFKGPYLKPFLNDQIKTKKHNSSKISLKNKNLTILPNHVDTTFNVYNGKRHFSLIIKNEMVGYKFGSFIFTRSAYKYKK